MGGPAVHNDFPPPIGSFLQEQGGWFNSNNMPRRTHLGLVLDPLETHNVALRLQNGSMGSRETITLENRARKNYGITPPGFLGNGLLTYRLISSEGISDKRISSERHIIPRDQAIPVIRRMIVLTHPGDWGEAWGIATDNSNITGVGQRLEGTSLDHLGSYGGNLEISKSLMEVPSDSTQSSSPLTFYDLTRKPYG